MAQAALLGFDMVRELEIQEAEWEKLKAIYGAPR
jgi:hypothetical protein